MILVTGGAGFVGRHIVRRLREEDRPVRVLARKPDRAKDLQDAGIARGKQEVGKAGAMRAGNGFRSHEHGHLLAQRQRSGHHRRRRR